MNTALPLHAVLALSQYEELTAHAVELPNTELFARMLASRAVGQGGLPGTLGLAVAELGVLLRRHFPGAAWAAVDVCAAGPERQPERAELLTLMLEHRVGQDDSEIWMAHIVAAACMAGNHLWQDLGLWNRADLSRLMTDNFPALAAKNTRDMKWKKFLYKQLCQQEGIYVCRSPSCEVCVDYLNCFGPET